MRTRKVVSGMFLTQASWTLWFLGILFIINIGKVVLAFLQVNKVDTFYNSVFVAANIYMLVIGILCFYFLTYFVENGVTRKEYFKGSLLAAIGISIMIPIIALVISTIEKLILQNFLAFNVTDFSNAVTESDGHFIADFILSIVLTPYVDPDTNWILALAVFSLNIFIYYILGWFIGVSFYRFKTLVGLGAIALSMVASLFIDSLLRASVQLPLLETFANIGQMSTIISLACIFISIVIILLLIRQITKRAPIKI